MTRLHRVAPAEIRRMWADKSMSAIDVASILGMTRRGLGYRVKIMGLPARPSGAARKIDSPLFDAMWRGGVKTQEIADYFSVSRRTVDYTVLRRGLEKRPKAWGDLISAETFFYANALRESAKLTRIAMREVEEMRRACDRSVAP